MLCERFGHIGRAELKQQIDRLFRIYHINLELLLGALQDHARVKDLPPLIADGRLQSVENFFDHLSQKYGSGN
ncbi:MAG TPA: hypothetical protein VF897_18130 [Roseiflexaceae bacterium]